MVDKLPPKTLSLDQIRKLEEEKRKKPQEEQPPETLSVEQVRTIQEEKPTKLPKNIEEAPTTGLIDKTKTPDLEWSKPELDKPATGPILRAPDLGRYPATEERIKQEEEFAKEVKRTPLPKPEYQKKQELLDKLLMKAPQVIMATAAPWSMLIYEGVQQMKNLGIAKAKDENYTPLDNRMLVELLPENTPESLAMGLSVVENLGDIALMSKLSTMAGNKLFNKTLQKVGDKLIKSGHPKEKVEQFLSTIKEASSKAKSLDVEVERYKKAGEKQVPAKNLIGEKAVPPETITPKDMVGYKKVEGASKPGELPVKQIEFKDTTKESATFNQMMAKKGESIGEITYRVSGDTLYIENMDVNVGPRKGLGTSMIDKVIADNPGVKNLVYEPVTESSKPFFEKYTKSKGFTEKVVDEEGGITASIPPTKPPKKPPTTTAGGPAEPSPEEKDNTINIEERKIKAESAVKETSSLSEINKITGDIEAIKSLRKEPNSAGIVKTEIANTKKSLTEFVTNNFSEEQQAKLLPKIKRANTVTLSSVAKQVAKDYNASRLTKKEIAKYTSITPERKQVIMREDMALRKQLHDQAVGAKAGFKEGKKVTREELIDRFRRGEQKIDDIVSYIKDNLPVEERGKFIDMAKNAKTVARQFKAFARVDNYAKEIDKKALVSDIKKIAEPVGSMAVDYQKRMISELDKIDLSKPSALTISKLKSLKNFLVNNPESGVPKERIDELKRLSQLNVRDMSKEELVRLKDTLESLRNLGKLKLELKYKYNQRERDKVLNPLLKSTRNVDPPKTNDREKDISRYYTKKYYIDTMFTSRVADMLDGYKGYTGENAKYIKRLGNKENEAKIETTNDQTDVLDKIKAVKNDWTIDEQAAIMFHIYKQQKAFEQAQGVVDRMKWGQEPPITPEMQKVIDIGREAVGKNYTRISPIFEELENRIMGKVENYFPIKYEREFNILPSETIEQTRYRTDQPFKGFTYGRKEGVDKPPRIDFFNIMQEAISEQNWYINMAPELENIKHLFKNKKYMEAAGELGADFWKNVLDVTSRRGWSATATSNPILRQGRVNLQQAILGFRPMSVAIQPFAIFDAMAYTMSRFGPTATARVMKEFGKSWINPKYAQEFIEGSKALQLRKSAGEVSLEETLESAKRHQKLYRNLVEWSMKPLQKADVITAAGVERGLYNTLKSEGLNHKDAMYEADFLMNLVSATSNVTQRPIILSKGEGERTWLTFQNFALNQWGIAWHDLINSGLINSKSIKDKMKAITGLGILIGGYIATNEFKDFVYEKVSGKKLKDIGWKTKIALAIPEMVPFFGNFVQMAEMYQKGYEKSVLPPIQRVLENAFKGGSDVVFSKWNTPKGRRQLYKGLGRVAESVASLKGVPGTSTMADVIEKIAE